MVTPPGGQEGLLVVVRAVACHMPGLPQWAWRYIPLPVALLLRKASKKVGSELEGDEEDILASSGGSSYNSGSFKGEGLLPVVEPGAGMGGHAGGGMSGTNGALL